MLNLIMPSDAITDACVCWNHRYMSSDLMRSVEFELNFLMMINLTGDSSHICRQDYEYSISETP